MMFFSKLCPLKYSSRLDKRESIGNHLVVAANAPNRQTLATGTPVSFRAIPVASTTPIVLRFSWELFSKNSGAFKTRIPSGCNPLNTAGEFTMLGSVTIRQ